MMVVPVRKRPTLQGDARERDIDQAEQHTPVDILSYQMHDLTSIAEEHPASTASQLSLSSNKSFS